MYGCNGGGDVYSNEVHGNAMCAAAREAMWPVQYVIMQLKRDPCVTGTQGDCRGGNKTVYNVPKRV